MLDVRHIIIHVPFEDKLGEVVKEETSVADKVAALCDAQLTNRRAVFDRDSLGVIKWGEPNILDAECVEVTTSIK